MNTELTNIVKVLLVMNILLRKYIYTSSWLKAAGITRTSRSNRVCSGRKLGGIY